jgi:hypothetical protein
VEKYKHNVAVSPNCLSRKQLRGGRDKTSVRFAVKPNSAGSSQEGSGGKLL